MFRLTVIFLIQSLLVSAGLVPVPGTVIKDTSVRFATPFEPRKRALLVGVSDYCRDRTEVECNSTSGKYWWNLNSANDVDAIEQTLLSAQFGFKREDVKVLKTKDETTHANIVNTFKSFLIEQTRPGDIVYFHFSGHGNQVADDDTPGNPKVGDELDGADESLIPSDYNTRQDGSNNIRDDELEQLLWCLTGRHVTVTVDSCYSGTITRGGLRLVRGMKSQRPLTPNPRGAEDGPSGIFAEGTSLPASVVVISAARNNQLASETFDAATKKDMGALSYSLVRALSESGSQTTYRDLFEKISSEVTRDIGNQNPQLEGSRDNILFSGTVLEPKPYISLKIDDRKVMLQAGSLQGMSKGSRFSIYPLGKDSRSGSPMVEGEIVTIGPTMSVLQITPSPDEQMLEKLRTARAFETFHNFGDARVKVLIEDGAKASLRAEGMRELREVDLLNVVDRPDDWQVRICRGGCQDEKLILGQEAAGPNVVTLMRNDGSIITRLAEGPNLRDSIRAALEGEARWRFIKDIRNDSESNLRIKMRLVPVTDVKQDPNTKLAISARDTAKEVEPLSGTQVVLHEGDTVMLEVMNLGQEETYLSVLDLRSDGSIAPLFPHPLVSLGVNENRIRVKNDKDGKPVWQRIPFPFVIRIGKPYGNEVFKAVLTRQDADFSPLFRLRDAEDIQSRRPRGTMRGADEARSPLGQILLTVTTGKLGGRRRGGPGDPRDDGTGLIGAADASKMGVPLEGWSTAEISFQSLPPRAAKNGSPQ
jgi:metacaspase-1